MYKKQLKNASWRTKALLSHMPFHITRRFPKAITLEHLLLRMIVLSRINITIVYKCSSFICLPIWPVAAYPKLELSRSAANQSTSRHYFKNKDILTATQDNYQPWDEEHKVETDGVAGKIKTVSASIGRNNRFWLTDKRNRWIALFVDRLFCLRNWITVCDGDSAWWFGDAFKF